MFKKSIAILLVLITCLAVFPVAASATANGTGFYQVTASSLNVRASATTSSDIVGSLSNGDLITVTAISGSWGQTVVDGVTGWVSLSYCNRLFYITFNANGGSGAPDAMLITDGASVAVPSGVPTLSGKTFKGWSTSAANATSGIISYSAGGQLGGSSYIAPAADMVLYACWAETTVSDPETEPATGSTIAPALSGETSRSVKTLYNGVTSTNIKTSSSSKYSLQNFNVVEFDLSQTDLYLDVTNTRTYANQVKTTLNTVTSFNSTNGEGKTAIAAINGDLWMTTYAHSRVEGSGTSYGGYSDAVVTSGLTLPRGFNVYDGEIVCSAYMQQETPYEGEFWSFGITDEYVPMIGCPELEITVTDTTKKISASADGLNRLPANDALVVYSDKGCLNNYALSDAYEVVIDCGYDYTVEHGAKITGTVVGIYSSTSSSNPTMTANRIILTARGSKTSLINGFAVGDTVTLDFSVTERYGRNTEGWQNVTNAVGGHMPFVVDGVKRETGTSTNYPTTIVGIKNDGSLCFIVNDGRQSSFSTGLDFNMYWDLTDDFDLNTAFILDGGGSATLVELASSGYSVVNSPSDGSARSVVNSVILSAGPKRSAQGDFEVAIPDPDVDLTQLHFATDEDYALIAGLNEAVSSQTVSGARLTVRDFYSSPGVVISYGLPNTTSYNPNSVLADISYPTVNASDYPYVVFDMSVVSADASLVQFQTLYTTTGARKGISQDTFIGFNNAYNNNGYGLYTLNPGSNSTFTGRLNTFHFGFFFPANGVTTKDGDYIILRSVRLAKTADEAAAMTSVVPSTLKFNANGGSSDRTMKYVIKGRAYGELPVPTRSGYRFDGWYTTASGGTLVTADTVTAHTGIRNLYAHWTSDHTHTWSAWSVTSPATCVIDGEESRSCTGCGITETRDIAASGEHSFGDWVTVSYPRCEVEGKKCRFCDDCDETVTEILPATGHTWGDWTVISYAHCDTEGTEAIFCDNCDEMQTRTIPAPGHTWDDEEIVSAPGCESEGTVIYYCAYCDEFVEETLAATGHSFGDWTVSQAPTCTEPGTNVRVCSSCKKTETESVSAIGHDWSDWSETVAPTVDREGEKSRTCANCGAIETESIPKLEGTLEYSVKVDNYKVIITGAESIDYIRYAPGVLNTSSEIKNAEGMVPINASVIAENTVNGVYTREMPDGGVYSFWIRFNDGSTVIEHLDLTKMTQSVSLNGLMLTVHDLYGVKDYFIVKGEYTAYNQFKGNYDMRVTASKINGAKDYTYTLKSPGYYTVCVRYTDTTRPDLFLYCDVDVVMPEITVDGLQVRVSNLDDIKVIRTAPGEWSTAGEVKRAAGNRNFTAKSAIKGADPYTIQYREDGVYTIAVEYTTGLCVVETVTIRHKEPTVQYTDNGVIFGELDGLNVIRYAKGEYSYSGDIKRAPGAKYKKPADIQNGVITVDGLEPGTYTFCVQYYDESFNYYVIVVE